MLPEPLCMKSIVKLNYRGPHLLNKFLGPTNSLSEVQTIEVL